MDRDFFEMRDSIKERLKGLVFSFPDIQEDELQKAAVEHFNTLGYRTFTREELAESGKLDRTCVNYLRHKHTDYDLMLESLCLDSANQSITRALFSIRALEAIEEKFFWLGGECDRQKQEHEEFLSVCEEAQKDGTLWAEDDEDPLSTLKREDPEEYARIMAEV